MRGEETRSCSEAGGVWMELQSQVRIILDFSILFSPLTTLYAWTPFFGLTYSAIRDSIRKVISQGVILEMLGSLE